MQSGRRTTAVSIRAFVLITHTFVLFFDVFFFTCTACFTHQNAARCNQELRFKNRKFVFSNATMSRLEAAEGSDGWFVLVALRGSAARRGCRGLDGWSVLIARAD
jgi:hypothetical protein